MQKILVFFRKHYPAVILALLVTVLVSLPNILFLYRMGDQFEGIWPDYNGDSLLYLSRIHEVLDGHAAINHPYYYENKDILYPQNTGGELFVAFLSWISGVSVPNLQIIMDFIAPAVMFFLTYIVFLQLNKRRLTALFFPLSIYIVSLAGLNKAIHPQISLPLLLIFLFFWIRLAISEKAILKDYVIAGFFLGLLFLVYFYHWSFVLVLLGVHAILLLYHRDFNRLKYYAILLGAAVIVGAPYFIRQFRSLGAPFYQETMIRFGLLHSHLIETFPRLAVAIFWLVLFMIFCRYYRLWQDRGAMVVCSMLLANIIYPNHQVVSGVIMQNAIHWSWMPLLIFALSAHYMLGVVSDGNNSNRDYLSYGISAAVIFFLAVPVVRYSTFTVRSGLKNYTRNNIYTKYENIQDYSDIFSWINDNTPVDSVIFSNLDFMRLVPVYTHDNVYYSENAYFLPASDEEVIERTLLSHFFDSGFFDKPDFGLTEDNRMIWQVSSGAERTVYRYLDRFDIKYDRQYGLGTELVKVNKVYDSLLDAGWDVSLLDRYRLDYIVWDRNLFPEWRIDKYDNFQLVYKKDNIEVYKNSSLDV